MLERLFPQQSDDKLYVEDVMSVFLYTGNGSTQTITNGIDLAGKGGMLWRKSRGFSGNHVILDTVRGIASYLESNTTSAAETGYNWIASFNSDGFTNNNNSVNGGDSVSWTFRKAPKFFDVVTYTGNGGFDHMIPHSLGVAPGCVIIKPVSASGNWIFSSRETASIYNYGLFLNTNGARAGTWDPVGTGDFNSTTFDTYIGNSAGVTNTNGVQYVAYLFAHDPSADGFIQCGSFAAGSNSAAGSATINLGWEPQWILTKNANGTSNTNWQIYDNMRGLTAARQPSYPSAVELNPNTSSAENDSGQYSTNATGFVSHGGYNPGDTIIYVAIRRGPMRTPTLGTSVFSPTKQTSTGYTQITGINFAPDFVFQKAPSDGGDQWNAVDKLRGPSASLTFNTTGTEVVDTQFFLGGFLNSGVKMGTASNGQFNGYNPNSLFFFGRAPGFMDVVCYTGNGTAGRTVNHNLGVAPELMIVKGRNNAGTSWLVYAAPLGATQSLFLNLNYQTGTYPYWNNTTPTATVFTVGSSYDANTSGGTYVSYLFASVPGVSKVGSYTGNGSSQTINCAFTTGARFVLIKRTDSTGDWYVWDSARGIVAGNDPYLALNDIQAEVTNNDSVDTDSTGFVVNQVAASNINVNAATYIFLSIA